MSLRDLNVPTRVRRDALRLRTALFATSFGNGLTGVVLTIQIVKNYHGTGVSAALLALSIGMLLSFASGGLHADRANRVRAIVVSDCVRGLANLAVVFGLLTAWKSGLVFVVLGCFVNGMCAGYFRPALSSLWAALIPAQQLKRVLSTNSLLNRIALAIGGGVGGVLISLTMGTLGILIDAFSFFFSAAVVMFNREPPRTDSTATHLVDEHARANALHRALARFNIVAQWKALFHAGRQSSWFNLWVKANIAFSLVSGVIEVCLPLVLVQRYSNSEIGIYSSISVFALLLGAVCARAIINLPVPGLLATWASCGQCLSAGLVAVGAPASAPTVVRFTHYTCNSLSAPSFNNYVAQQFSADQRGKVYAMQAGASSVLSPLGMLLASALLVWFPAASILTISSAAGFILAALPLVKRAAWNLTITK